MQSDYSGILESEFVRSLKNFVAFRLTEMNTPVAITATPASPTKLSLDNAAWDNFEIGKIFDVKKGKRLTQADQDPGETPFIGATETNNGLTNWIDADPRHPGNLITVVYNGNNVAEAFYQPDPFWCSDDVNVLYPKFDLDPEVALFVSTIIRREKYRFNYGRKWNKARMEKSFVRLPAKGNAPDLEFMRNYIRGLPFSADLRLSDPKESTE